MRGRLESAAGPDRPWAVIRSRRTCGALLEAARRRVEGRRGRWSGNGRMSHGLASRAAPGEDCHAPARMSPVPALLTFAGGIALVVLGAELFFDGVLALAARLGVSAFVLTAVVSGFELENLAAGIAANARGLSGAAAGTFLGGTTFLALGVARLAAAVAPIPARLPLPP